MMAGTRASDDRPGLASRREGAERIVSLTPSNTEILCALGARDRLVGISTYCDHPAEIADLPRVGRFIDADGPAIAKLRPDLVVTSPHLQKEIVADLVERDLAVLALNPTSLEDVFRDMLLLGALVGATAFDLIYRGRVLSAEEARKFDLVNEVADPSGIDAMLDSLAAGLASANAVALRIGRRAYFMMDGLDGHDRMVHAGSMAANLLRTEVASEGYRQRLGSAETTTGRR